MFELFISSVWVIFLPFILTCPSQEKLHPCTCESTGYTSKITCPDLENEQVLVDAVYALKGMNKFYSFIINNGNFMFIPHDIFKDVKFQELEIRSSSFMALTDTDVALEGLDEELTSLVVTDCTMLNDWDWNVLRHLKQLLKLHVDVDLEIVSKDIKDISSPNIKDISLANNKITYVHESAFDGFKELLALSLKNNLISEVKRSMMPNPAVLLWKLDLSHNQIQQLPPDLFENMPSLEALDITSNKLLTLNEKPFNKVWERLQYFEATGNPLRCDCRLEWMLDLKFPGVTNAVCDQPMQLRGRQIKDLTGKDIWCRRKRFSK